MYVMKILGVTGFLLLQNELELHSSYLEVHENKTVSCAD